MAGLLWAGSERSGPAAPHQQGADADGSLRLAQAD